MKETGILIPSKKIKTCGKNHSLKIEHCLESEEEVYCHECDDNFCKLCFDKIHSSSKKKQGHERRPLEEKKKKCDVHKYPLDHFCFDCYLQICLQCVLESHKNHQTITLAESYDLLKKDILDDIKSHDYERKMKKIIQNHQKNIERNENEIKRIKLETEAEKMVNFEIESKLKELQNIENQVQISNQISDLLKFKHEVDLIKQDEKFHRKNTLTIDAHTNMIYSMIQSKNGNIISASEDCIKIWDKNWKCINTIVIDTVAMIIIENKEDKIVVGFNDSDIFVFDQLGENLDDLVGHKDQVLCLLDSSNGNLISGSCDKTIKVWDQNGVCIFTLTDHLSNINALIETHDEYIVSGSSDRTIKIWDKSEEYECVQTFIGHNGGVVSLVEDRDGNIWSGSQDLTIKIWDRKGNCLKTILGHSDNMVLDSTKKWEYCIWSRRCYQNMGSKWQMY